MKCIHFLSKEEVIAQHNMVIRVHGGSWGIRDEGLLESAISQPQMSFGGKFVHYDIFEMAAAYLYHIAKNHPFVDGNKRTAFFASVNFLNRNHGPLMATQTELYELTMLIANSKLSKMEAAAFFRNKAENN